MVIRVDVTSINEMKSTPSAEMRSLAGERFHVSKVDEDRPTQSSVKCCRQGNYAFYQVRHILHCAFAMFLAQQ